MKVNDVGHFWRCDDRWLQDSNCCGNPHVFIKSVGYPRIAHLASEMMFNSYCHATRPQSSSDYRRRDAKCGEGESQYIAFMMIRSLLILVFWIFLINNIELVRFLKLRIGVRCESH